MEHLKMTGDFYDDVERVGEAISYVQSMLELLEKECMERDKGKTATGMFIRINDMKRESEKMVSESKRLIRDADIEHYGPLSRFVRPYLDPRGNET